MRQMENLELKIYILDFGLGYNFALSYFDDELREQGLDPDNEYKYKDNQKPSLSFYV
jgi:hypothetical protein